jgi:hypothetical protein
VDKIYKKTISELKTNRFEPIVNFSLRKEIFFVAIGSLVGAITMHMPRMFMDLFGDSSYQECC